MKYSIDEMPNRDHLRRMLESIGTISDEERLAIQALPVRIRMVAAGHDLVRDGDAPVECCIILSGLACRYKALNGGLRQIMSFHLPGDMPDLQSLHLGRMDHGLGALPPTKAAFIPHADITQLVRQFPTLSDLLWKSTLIEAAISREWLISLGRRSAVGRISHLFCEVHARTQANGVDPSDTVTFRVTQAELSDAMGLSAVHVNRVMKELKDTHGVTLRSGRLTTPDWSALALSCEFEPAYLHHHERA